MASTPPPPSRRLRTPPAPFLGPKYDAYEPYSPRRSSRIHPKRDQHSFSETMPQSEAPSRLSNVAKKPLGTKIPAAKRLTIKRTSSQTFSPPSSPISPGHNLNLLQGRQSAHRLDSTRRHAQVSDLDSDVDMPGLQPKSSTRKFQHGIPTPSKTPRKKAAQDAQQFQSTARVLFPSNDVLSSPRKARKNRLATLASDEFEGGSTANNIQIYTDSKDMIPEEIAGEDNPFLSRRSPRTARSTTTNTGPKIKYGITLEVDEAVERGEGMVYSFRGKKFYRKFLEGEDTSIHSNGSQLVNDDEALRQAGHTASRPFSRKDIKPRRLFPPKDIPPGPDDADEEAMTDIEPEIVPSASQPEATTPTKHTFRPATPATPPASVKKNKAKASRDDDSDAMLTESVEERRAAQRTIRMKTTPFDEWSRTKPGVSKRTHEAVEQAGEGSSSNSSKGKRSKNGGHVLG